MWPWRFKQEPAVPLPVKASEPPAQDHRFEAALLNRAHQQAAVAALGQQALTGVDIQTLLEHATLFISQTLSVELSCVQQLDPGGRSLHTAASFGYLNTRIDEPVPLGPRSMSEHIFQSAEPFIVRNLRATTRFMVPAFLSEAGAISGVSLVIRTGQGPWGLLHAHCRRLRTFDEDDFHFLQSVANVIGTACDRRRADEESAKLSAFARYNPNPVVEFNASGGLTYCNDATRALTSSLGLRDPLEILPPNSGELVQECLREGTGLLDLHVNVGGRALAWSFFPIPTTAHVHAYAVEVTERLNLEEQLRQSQKMEAIGQLAAGVAHDFNNILTIMQGLIHKIGVGTTDPDEALAQLSDTTERAAALTRQLLAFSRRQVMQKRTIDLREVVSGISRMLQRLIGEDIVLTVSNPPHLPAIEADPSMIEQILLNLAVNARDAMPRGGQLVISTDEVLLDDRSGNYLRQVRLRVQDTGCGMTEEIKTRIFEPFFTTKEVGKGTGLGLATVFGIVKQHSGFIDVETELGLGTTFSICLPASDKQPEMTLPPVQTLTTSPVSGGAETILLVEDEPLLRELAQMILTTAGYKVLEAGETDQALDLWHSHQGEIALLLTDMVLPGGKNGRDLAVELQRRKPQLKVIYTTGYSPDLVDPVEPANFLQKPYPPDVLTRTVRACLDAR